MFLIQCYNSTVLLGYPLTCNEAVICLSTLETLCKTDEVENAIIYGLALTRIERKASLYSKGYTACKQTC